MSERRNFANPNAILNSIAGFVHILRVVTVNSRLVCPHGQVADSACGTSDGFLILALLPVELVSYTTCSEY